MQTYTLPAAPAGWFLSDHPTEGALVVPLGCTEADLLDALARGWRPLLLSKVNTRTGRATAHTSELEARPVVYSSRDGGGWRANGQWVRFATPRTPEPEPVADAPSCEAVLLADDAPAPVRPAWLYEPHRTARPGLPGWLRDAQADAARRDRQRQAGTRPAWLYEQPQQPDEPRLRAQTADDSHEGVGPTPAPDVFEQARRTAARKLREHEAACVRCATDPWRRCRVGEARAQLAWDAQQAADGTLAGCRP